MEALVPQAGSGEHLPAQHVGRQRRKRPGGQPPPRRLSCVVRGRLCFLAALVSAQGLPLGKLVPQAWPENISPPRKLPRPSHQRERQRKREKKHRARARARTAA